MFFRMNFINSRFIRRTTIISRASSFMKRLASVVTSFETEFTRSQNDASGRKLMHPFDPDAIRGINTYLLRSHLIPFPDRKQIPCHQILHQSANILGFRLSTTSPSPSEAVRSNKIKSVRPNPPTNLMLVPSFASSQIF